MEGLSTPLGIVLIVVAAFVVIKAVKLAVKIAMVVVAGIGLYLWLGT